MDKMLTGALVKEYKYSHVEKFSFRDHNVSIFFTEMMEALQILIGLYFFTEMMGNCMMGL